jgi:DNA-binding FadR family transcriptional regulator
VEALADLIVSRGLRPGDLLPAEPELCVELGIGRNSLREAIRELRATGMVEVRHGSGTYVGELSMAALSDELLFHSKLAATDSTVYLRNLMEVRDALEQGLISNLVTDGRMPDVDRLSTLLAMMDAEAQSGTIDPRTDQEFHEVLYEPLNNPVAILLLRVFWRVFGEILSALSDDPVNATKTADRHHAILLAVKASDARGARNAMQNHFLGLRARLGMAERLPD